MQYMYSRHSALTSPSVPKDRFCSSTPRIYPTLLYELSTVVVAGEFCFMHVFIHCCAIVLLSMCMESFAAAPHRDVMIDVAPNIKLHVIESGPSSNEPVLVLIPGWRL